jgi:hypothetical protein
MQGAELPGGRDEIKRIMVAMKCAAAAADFAHSLMGLFASDAKRAADALKAAPDALLRATFSSMGAVRARAELGFPEWLAAHARQLWLYEQAEAEEVEEALQALCAQATQ